MERRSPLYALEALGITHPWVTWRIARGDLGELCDGCGGRRFTVESPCMYRDSWTAFDGSVRQASCSIHEGCGHCRRKCRACGGAGVKRTGAIHAEDFGSGEDEQIARRLMPNLQVDRRKRIDMEAGPLGG